MSYAPERTNSVFSKNGCLIPEIINEEYSNFEAPIRCNLVARSACAFFDFDFFGFLTVRGRLLIVGEFSGSTQVLEGSMFYVRLTKRNLKDYPKGLKGYFGLEESGKWLEMNYGGAISDEDGIRFYADGLKEIPFDFFVPEIIASSIAEAEKVKWWFLDEVF